MQYRRKMISPQTIAAQKFAAKYCFLTQQAASRCVLGVLILLSTLLPAYSESIPNQIGSIQLMKAPEPGKNEASKKLSIVIESQNESPVTTVKKNAQGTEILLSPRANQAGLTYQGSSLLNTPDQQWVGQVVSKDGSLSIILPHLSPKEVSVNFKTRNTRPLKSTPSAAEPAGESITALLSPYLGNPSSTPPAATTQSKKGQIPPPPQFYFPEWKPSTSVVSLKELTTENLQPKPPKLPMGPPRESVDNNTLNSWFLPSPPELNNSSSTSPSLSTSPSTAASNGPSVSADPAPFKQLDSGTVSSQDSSIENTARFKQPVSGLNTPVRVAGLTFPLWVLTVLTLCFGGLGIFGLCGGLVFLKILVLPYFPEKLAPEKSSPANEKTSSVSNHPAAPLPPSPSSEPASQEILTTSGQSAPQKPLASSTEPIDATVTSMGLPEFSDARSIETAVKLSLMLKSISKNRPMTGLRKKKTDKKTHPGHIPFFFAQ